MEEQKFEVLKFHHLYEISTTEPWNIRRIGKQNCLTQNVTQNGYLKVQLGDRGTQLIHRLVAFQYIPNDEPEIKKYFDHINRNKLDNSVENLRWVTQSENMKNSTKSCYQKRPDEYIDEMPENIHQIDFYHRFEFESYYFDIDNERILYITKTNRIKVIHPIPKTKSINMTDINGIRHSFVHARIIQYFQQFL